MNHLFTEHDYLRSVKDPPLNYYERLLKLLYQGNQTAEGNEVD